MATYKLPTDPKVIAGEIMKHAFVAIRTLDGEVLELWAADTSEELRELAGQLAQKGGKVESFAKPN